MFFNNSQLSKVYFVFSLRVVSFICELCWGFYFYGGYVMTTGNLVFRYEEVYLQWITGTGFWFRSALHPFNSRHKRINGSCSHIINGLYRHLLREESKTCPSDSRSKRSGSENSRPSFATYFIFDSIYLVLSVLSFCEKSLCDTSQQAEAHF